MAAYTEITMEQGATFSTTINVTDVYNNSVNLASYTAASMMRKSYYTNSFYVIDAEVTNASEGEVTLSVSSSNTSIIVPGRYVYDVTVNDGANTVTRIVEGIVTVLPSVTR